MVPFLSDLALIVLTVWAEARGESFEGKVAVCEVIRNRMKKKYESDGSIHGTILYPLAFSCWNATDKQRVRMSKLALEDPMALRCLAAWTVSKKTKHTNGALHYLNPRLAKKPAKFGARLARIGNHDFHSPKAKTKR